MFFYISVKLPKLRNKSFVVFTVAKKPRKPGIGQLWKKKLEKIL